MAIDTAEKRKSISGIGMTAVHGVTPNAAKDGEWRAESAHSYSGIAVGSLAGTAQTTIVRLVGAFHEVW